jgi:dienelactone hydrolase
MLTTLIFMCWAPPILDTPDPAYVASRYQRAETLASRVRGAVTGLEVRPNWYADGKKMWFVWTEGGKPAYVSVDCRTGSKSPLFDSVRLSQAVKAGDGGHSAGSFQVDHPSISDDGLTLSFQAFDHAWVCDLRDYSVKSAPMPGTQPTRNDPWNQNLWPPERAWTKSPDEKWAAAIEADSVVLKSAGGSKSIVATGSAANYYAKLQWSPDSSKLIAFRVLPGDRRSYMYLEESPDDGGPPVLHKRIYDRPGDRVDTFQIELIDPGSSRVTPVAVPPIDYGDMPEIRWTSDHTHFTFEEMERGYSEFRIYRVDESSGVSQTILDDHPKTFVDSTSQYIDYLPDDSMIWRSEQDGWGQLYFVWPDGTIRNRITTGKWVVRDVVRVDEKRQRIVFAASGIHPNEDPYFIHYYSVGFDGKGMTELTPEPGDHSATISPDGDVLCDSCSTVRQAPVHRLRRVSDGSLVCELGGADDSALVKLQWKYPEPFKAKGRDGKTDIWGVIYRPQDYSPHRRYPVIEDIYAGPQDSFVPKSYRPFFRDQALAELGFIVVQIDGMGTRNRGKAFHDVCYKNLKDQGFPDRILWMKALAGHDPAADIGRVGVFGTSAGGQGAAAAVIFHPEFYKVAVASCGCHDNRLDKLWWNEQWMGYPVGPEYSACSNIDNAAKMQGNLLLMVGELDNNVPPESTFRLGNALQKASKDFDLVIIRGSDHTDGGPYGERKRRDFFVRHLLGVEPPAWAP